MAKRMSDDDVMNHVYGNIFGDLDGIESHKLFDEDDMDTTEGAVDNALPASSESGGMKITIEPIMKGAEEGGKVTDNSAEDEDEDKLKGIADMSPLMARLHGGR